MNENENIQSITSRLDVIIKLLLSYLTQNKKEKTQITLVCLVKEFRQLGFNNSEIARFLGRNKEQIAKLAYENKRRKKEKNKKEK